MYVNGACIYFKLALTALESICDLLYVPLSSGNIHERAFWFDYKQLNCEIYKSMNVST